MGVTHHLDGTLQENLHGWFDAGLEPRVVVEPGDRVVYNTPDAMWDRDAPDADADSETDRPRLTRPKGAGHALTGPVRIQGAESGDPRRDGLPGRPSRSDASRGLLPGEHRGGLSYKPGRERLERCPRHAPQGPLRRRRELDHALHLR